eukprot:maker-scaffold119_size336447-snap-gene-0.14 protein:Tk11773 transcript:maker-scaffold119_size336447-snap-gene-0.14-mRNA-1 annotation:"cuticular protein 46"
MKQFIAVVALAVAVASGARLPRDSGYQPAGGSAAQSAEPIGIVRSVFNAPSADSQNYDFSFETENGIQQEASGELKTIDDNEVIVMRGSYTYIDANGEDVTVSWVADENGYRAESSILPVAPAIPFPEQAEAVAAQIAFAQQEEQQASASSNSYSSAPAPANRYAAAPVPAPANNRYEAAAPSNQYAAAPAPAPANNRYEAAAPSNQYELTAIVRLGRGRGGSSLIAAGGGGSRGVGVGGGSGLLLLLLGEADLSGHSLGLLGEGDLGGNGQDGRLGPVAILIGHPGHGHILAIGIDVSVAAAHHHHLDVVDGLHLAGGLLLDAILGLEGEVVVLRLGRRGVVHGSDDGDGLGGLSGTPTGGLVAGITGNAPTGD